MVTKAGACGDEIEHLDGLGTERPDEGGVAAECVDAGDAALFVGGAAQR